MQVSPLGSEFGLEPDLVDWYPDATSVPYGCFLADLSI